ncbi:hypothetical protein [Lyngbya aestuarii]|uniref:hypothetical protein n=1 Tax=Lyngbya aestuarii TaxID=118322 RepID=UPI00403E2938
MDSQLSFQSSLVICPGSHNPQLTQDFLEALHCQEQGNLSNSWTHNLLIFPTQNYPAYSPIHILEFLRQRVDSERSPIVFIGFSAGVAGAIGAAWGWQLSGGKVKALIAVDGWGVPLSGNFPIHRISHDYFTHWSSALLGNGEDSFYADPAIEHLQLWQKPDFCEGWWVRPARGGIPEQRTFTTAARLIMHLLQRYS